MKSSTKFFEEIYSVVNSMLDALKHDSYGKDYALGYLAGMIEGLIQDLPAKTQELALNRIKIHTGEIIKRANKVTA